MKHLRVCTLLIFSVLAGLSTAASAEVKNKAAAKNRTSAAQQSLLVELTGKDVSKENDMSLYAEMVSAYQRNDEISFKSRLQSMLERFPNSIYADNALFLAGRFAVDNKNYPQAIKYFSRVEKEYPRSSSVAAARYAKAMTYKRMNLPEFAKASLKDVRARYPGSPESFRADTELQLTK